MGYFDTNNRWVNTEAKTLAASAARTASGTGSAVALGESKNLRLTLAVTAKSGTAPSLFVQIETSADGSTWRSLGGFTALNDATGSQTLSFPGADRYVRAKWTVSGTDPSFTFSVSGESAG
jgi:hypothetical protein